MSSSTRIRKNSNSSPSGLEDDGALMDIDDRQTGIDHEEAGDDEMKDEGAIAVDRNNTATTFQHPDIVHRLPVFLSTSLANTRTAFATAANGGPSPFPFATPSTQHASTTPQGPQPGPTLHTFQYPIMPAKHPLPVPESARARNIKPAMRWKSRNNIVQIELPLDNHPSAFNEDRAEELERGAERARKMTGAPGLPSSDGGAASGSSSSRSGSGINDGRSSLKNALAGSNSSGSGSRSRLKAESLEDSSGSKSNHNRTGKLDRTRLESFEVPSQHADLFIGIIRDGAVHLAPLDTTSQLRPNLHYLDALDDIDKQEKKRARALAAAAAVAASASDMELSGLSSGDEVGGPPGGPSSNSKQAAGGGANAKKAVNVTVSLRGEAGDSRRGGPGAGGGGRFGNSLGAGADARDALMGAIWDAEAERWTDMQWHDEESPEAEAFLEQHLFTKNMRSLICQQRQAEYVCS